MGNQSDLPQATKPYTIVKEPNHRDSSPGYQPLFPLLILTLQNQQKPPLHHTLHLFPYYAETSEQWSVLLLAVGVRLRSKHLACEVTNQGETFAIIVRGREKIFEPSPIPPHKATTPSQRTFDKTVKYQIYDRSSGGSSLPRGDGLKNSSPSTWIVPYGGHQQ